MAYSEFSPVPCANNAHSNYSNAADDLGNPSYSNCTNTHGNYGNWGCANYTNCYNVHANYANDCYQHTNYQNAVSASATNGGASAISVTWPSQWDVAKDTGKFTDSVEEMKAIRDNIQTIRDNRRKGITANNSTAGSTNITLWSPPALSWTADADATFNDSNAGTVENTQDTQINTLISNLNSLWSAINGGSSGLSTVAEGSVMTADLVNNLKTKVNELAAVTVTYSNHFNYANAGTHTNYTDWRYV